MKEIKDWIKAHETEFAGDLSDWIAYPSISKKEAGRHPFGKDCARMLDAALAWCQAQGMHTENHEYYCGTAVLPGETDNSIGIITHLDVVPEGEGWTDDPYRARVQNGRVTGRGSADDKGPALAALYALRYLREQGVRLRHSICVYFGCSEETGMEDLEYYLSKKPKLPVFSLVPDARFSVCNGEKGKLDLWASAPLQSGILQEFSAGTATNCVPGTAQAFLRLPTEQVIPALSGLGIPYACRKEPGGVRITVKGKAAHAAFPDGSIPAQRELAALLCGSGLLEPEAEGPLRALCSLLEDCHGGSLDAAYETPEFGKLTHVSGLTSLEDGRLSLSFDIRYPAGRGLRELRSRIDRRLSSLGFEAGCWKDDPPYYLEPDLPVIRSLREISEEVWERELPTYVMGGGTYARKLPNAVPYGPGLPRTGLEGKTGRGSGHQPDESVELEVLMRGIEIYVRALMKVDELIP